MKSRVGSSDSGRAVYQSRFDRFIGMLERSAHALRMGLVLAGVVVGSIALFIAFNGPKAERAEELAALLAEGPQPVRAVAPDGWTHMCLGAPGQDVRELIRAETDEEALACAGFNQTFFFYEGYAAIGFVSALGCDIMPVPEALFSPSGGEPRCEARRGLMMMELVDGDAGPKLTVERK